jgi:hypothetical protein
MEIEDQDQYGTDFDWFGVDECGEIGHFTTAGFKKLPGSVSSSAEDLAFVADYFLKQAPIRGSHRVEPTLAQERPGWKGESQEERYLRSFIAMADRGLFSFDIDSYLGPNTAYFRVALPVSPLCLSDLPNRIRDVLGRTIIKGPLLRDRLRIPYEETLAL